MSQTRKLRSADAEIARRRGSAPKRMDNVGEDAGSGIGEGNRMGGDTSAEFNGWTDLGADGSSVTRAFSTGSHSSTSSAALPKLR